MSAPAARPSRVLCTAHVCTRPVGLNGFFCVQDWGKLGGMRRDGIERADRRGDGALLRARVHAARRFLSSEAPTHAR